MDNVAKKLLENYIQRELVYYLIPHNIFGHREKEHIPRLLRNFSLEVVKSPAFIESKGELGRNERDSINDIIREFVLFSDFGDEIFYDTSNPNSTRCRSRQMYLEVGKPKDHKELLFITDLSRNRLLYKLFEDNSMLFYGFEEINQTDPQLFQALNDYLHNPPSIRKTPDYKIVYKHN